MKVNFNMDIVNFVIGIFKFFSELSFMETLIICCTVIICLKMILSSLQIIFSRCERIKFWGFEYVTNPKKDGCLDANLEQIIQSLANMEKKVKKFEELEDQINSIEFKKSIARNVLKIMVEDFRKVEAMEKKEQLFYVNYQKPA